jgi:hypothetical protein
MDLMAGLRAAMAADDAYYKDRGIFQGKSASATAGAIVIDMAYGWTDPAYAGGSARLDSAIAAIQKLLPACRTKSADRLYDLGHSRAADQVGRRLLAEVPQVGPPRCESTSASNRSRPSTSSPRNTPAAFAGTPLVGWLIGHQVDTLLITGCSTSLRRATAVDAKAFS